MSSFMSHGPLGAPGVPDAEGMGILLGESRWKPMPPSDVSPFLSPFYCSRESLALRGTVAEQGLMG